MIKIVNLAYILTVLILFDLIATLYWVHSGLATEANPLMNFYFEQSSFLFIFVKLALSFSGLSILYFFRTRFRKIILHTLLGLNIIYIGVCIYHLWGMLFLLFQTN